MCPTLHALIDFERKKLKFQWYAVATLNLKIYFGTHTYKKRSLIMHIRIVSVFIRWACDTYTWRTLLNRSYAWMKSKFWGNVLHHKDYWQVKAKRNGVSHRIYEVNWAVITYIYLRHSATAAKKSAVVIILPRKTLSNYKWHGFAIWMKFIRPSFPRMEQTQSAGSWSKQKDSGYVHVGHENLSY